MNGLSLSSGVAAVRRMEESVRSRFLTVRDHVADRLMGREQLAQLRERMANSLVVRSRLQQWRDRIVGGLALRGRVLELRVASQAVVAEQLAGLRKRVSDELARHEKLQQLTGRVSDALVEGWGSAVERVPALSRVAAFVSSKGEDTDLQHGPNGRAPEVARPPSVRPPVALQAVREAFEAHPQKAALVRAADDRDQLYRALLPLYLTRDARVDVTSGIISAFWQEQGVRFAAPNAAKAIRQNSGYARPTAQGRRITPRGIEYVEQRLVKTAG